MILATLALQWLRVTGGGSYKHREALNKSLASPEACVFHTERLTSLYNSFCYIFYSYSHGNCKYFELCLSTCLSAVVLENTKAT